MTAREAQAVDVLLDWMFGKPAVGFDPVKLKAACLTLAHSAEGKGARWTPARVIAQPWWGPAAVTTDETMETLFGKKGAAMLKRMVTWRVVVESEPVAAAEMIDMQDLARARDTVPRDMDDLTEFVADHGIIPRALKRFGAECGVSAERHGQSHAACFLAGFLICLKLFEDDLLS